MLFSLDHSPRLKFVESRKSQSCNAELSRMDSPSGVTISVEKLGIMRKYNTRRITFGIRSKLKNNSTYFAQLLQSSSSLGLIYYTQRSILVLTWFFNKVIKHFIYRDAFVYSTPHTTLQAESPSIFLEDSDRRVLHTTACHICI